MMQGKDPYKMWFLDVLVFEVGLTVVRSSIYFECAAGAFVEVYSW
jgi:hypothetical protein